MLKKGDIDLMSDVSFTEERAEEMLFPSLPMGTEEYYRFTSPKNKTIRSENYASLNGKKVGVNKDSIQEQFFVDWEKDHGVKAKVIRQTCTDEYILQSGSNAYLTPDENKWLEKHGPIRVGYLENYLAFCAKDPETGELTGTLRDYLDYTDDCLKNVHVDYEEGERRDPGSGAGAGERRGTPGQEKMRRSTVFVLQ